MPNASNTDLESYDLDALPATDTKEKSWKSMQLKYLRVLAGVLVLCLIGLSVYTIVLSSHTKGNADTAPYECTTEDCIKTAADVLNAMNREVNPCDDFYEFACGGWLDNNPSDISNWGQAFKLEHYQKEKKRELLEDDASAAEGQPTIVNKVKSLYKSCKNVDPLESTEEEVSSMHRVLSSVGLPTTLPQSWSGTPWYEQDARSNRMLGISTLISVKFDSDSTNHSEFVLMVEKPRPGEDFSFMELKKNTDFIFLDPEAEIGQSIENDASFYTMLEKLSPSEEWENVAIYDSAIPEYVQIYLKGYLDILFENTTVQLNLHEDQLLIDVPYLIALSELLNKTDPLVVEQYMYFNVISKMGEKTSTSEGCIDYIYHNLGPALDCLYVQKYFRNFPRHKVIEMVDNIRDAFGAGVKSLDWLDEETRFEALKKLGAIRKSIGFSDWQLSPELSRIKLDEYYKTVEVVEGDFYESYIKLQQWKFNKEFINKKIKLKEWAEPPSYSFNAFNDYNSNTISIPITVLQRPFYDTGFEAINYGSVGAIIGHEITHGFDNNGRKYDENGYLRNWWTNATLERYENKKQCFVEQYNQYKVDGELSLGENIADNGGLHAAFNGFKLYTQRNPDSKQARLPGIPQYNLEQLFFLSFGQAWCGKQFTIPNDTDSHPPDKTRVIGTLRNSQEFADAWKCPVGSPMNPEHKCVLW